jgi:glycosyltransferase involved in cell wall biosynthesis
MLTTRRKVKNDIMHITIVYPGVIPVLKYGGTGRDIWYEGRELVNRGHRVTYLVGRGSTCPFAEVIPFDPSLPYGDQIPEHTDLIHMHVTPNQPLPKPHLVTIHGNPKHGESLDVNTVFVSASHARNYGSDTWVYNGMDWDDYGPVEVRGKKTHVHFLGNAAWRVKNLKGAIAVARMAGERLVVLGGNRLNFRMGFRFTPDRHVQFRGFVGGEEKFNAMRTSRGLIFPVLWNEPMGLAIIESLYFGAPVFGTPYGSLPELVPSDVGYLSNSAASLAAAVQDAGAFNAQRCHEYARDCFNAGVMTTNYLKLFERVLNGHALNPEPPSLMIPDARDLLPWFP